MTRPLPFDPDAVSRDPSDYRQTQHCRQQIRYRKMPSPNAELLCAAIREGDLQRSPHDKDHQVCFAYAPGAHTWHVIADLRGSPPHPLVTVYAKDAHGKGEHGGVPL